MRKERELSRRSTLLEWSPLPPKIGLITINRNSRACQSTSPKPALLLR